MKNSIVTIALSSKFTAEQIEGVLEIVHATPNPEVAVEILLGIYEEPKLPLEPVNLKNFDNTKRNIVLSGYDKFNELVSYKYYTMKTVSGWVENGLPEIPVNIASNNRWAEDAARSLKMELEDFKTAYTHHIFDVELEKDSEGNPKLYSGNCELYTWMNGERKRR
jgi:hypothetical protein